MGLDTLSKLTTNFSNFEVIEFQFIIVKQLETRPITGQRLLSELKGIYAGLVMVEARCVEVGDFQAKAMKKEGLKFYP